jgi:hypothetical protein
MLGTEDNDHYLECQRAAAYIEQLEANSKHLQNIIIGINDCIDEVLSKAPLETDHGHHVDENGWLKGKLNER